MTHDEILKFAKKWIKWNGFKVEVINDDNKENGPLWQPVVRVRKGGHYANIFIDRFDSACFVTINVYDSYCRLVHKESDEIEFK